MILFHHSIDPITQSLIHTSDQAVEILDPERGEAFPWSPFKTVKDDTRTAPSRLCKAANFYRFKVRVKVGVKLIWK